MTTFANTINNLTPGSAGEIVRMYLLRAHHGVDYATSGAVILVERIGAIGYLASSALLVWLTWLGVLPVPIAVVLAIVLVASPAIVYRCRAATVEHRPPDPTRAPRRRESMAACRRLAGARRRHDRRPDRRSAPPPDIRAAERRDLHVYDVQLLLVGRALGVDGRSVRWMGRSRSRDDCRRPVAPAVRPRDDGPDARRAARRAGVPTARQSR